MEQQKEIVLITGITGFIATHIAKIILEQQTHKFKLRGTLRSLNKSHIVKEALTQELSDQIEFVEADLEKVETLIPAIKGVSYIIHTANPIPGSKKLSVD